MGIGGSDGARVQVVWGGDACLCPLDAGWLAGWWDFEFLNPTGTTQRARFCQRVDATRWKVGCNQGVWILGGEVLQSKLTFHDLT